MSTPRKIGILALQGAVDPHAEKLLSLGVDPVRVIRDHDLSGLSGIILPGGESTTFLHLLKVNELWEPLNRFVRERPTWGICAGAILLASRVTHPAQRSLDVVDMTISRNAFGRQISSFTANLTATENWTGEKREIEGVFIRAPRFLKVGQNTKPLFLWNEEYVMVEQDHYLASAFHPELTNDTTLHRYFLDKCEAHHGQSIS